MENIYKRINEVRTLGLKGTYKKYGWKFVLAVFVYYLVRDVTLYIIIPAWVIKNSV